MINRLLFLLSSLRITCICIVWLFVLTFWGTVAQVTNGLYQSQERFFFSWFFHPHYFLPLPGAQLTMWVLFLNLLASLWTRSRIEQGMRYAGLRLTHFGILLYLAAAFLTFICSQESYLHLKEGQGSNVSTSYSEWELAYWTEPGPVRHVKAVDLGNISDGERLPFKAGDFQLKLLHYYPNCIEDRAYQLQPKSMDMDRERNIAGGLFQLAADGKTRTLSLFGGADPMPVTIQGQTYYLALQHKKYQLPFIIFLERFHVEFYPATDIAKSYQSNVLVIKDQIQRQARIYMNNPLSEKDFTLFQASYEVDPDGQQSSVLAVVKNAARGWPYVACFVVLAGLILHFVIKAFDRKRPI